MQSKMDQQIVKIGTKKCTKSRFIPYPIKSVAFAVRFSPLVTCFWKILKHFLQSHRLLLLYASEFLKEVVSILYTILAVNALARADRVFGGRPSNPKVYNIDTT